MKSPRTRAALVLAAVTGKHQRVDDVMEAQAARLAERDRGLLRELVQGSCRHYAELDAILAQLLSKPLKARDEDVRAVLLIGLHQMLHMRVPDHAAVAEAVNATRQLEKHWASGLVNAVLRAFQARRAELLAALDEAARSAHPRWLHKAIRRDWPESFDAILAANNQPGPLTLRVNRRLGSRAAWLALAAAQGIEARAGELAEDAVTLAHAVDVAALPGFADGHVSVQDESAQLAAGLLDCRAGERVLDACAAPGGKACHLLEAQPGIELLALDSNPRRLPRIEENLHRLGLQATVVAGDATAPDGWWDGRPFDRILVDAPCSGTGVIRRHPDIKILRTPADVERAGTLQRAILAGLWATLRPGGTLLYATCSILAAENEGTIAAFLATTPDARELPIAGDWGVARRHGRQLLPMIDAHDGFYYALLAKAGESAGTGPIHSR